MLSIFQEKVEKSPKEGGYEALKGQNCERGCSVRTTVLLRKQTESRRRA